MNPQVLVVNGGNEVTDVSSLFVSLYVQLPVFLPLCVCVLHNNVIKNPHKLYNGQLQLIKLKMLMLDLGEPIINICLTIRLTVAYWHT